VVPVVPPVVVLPVVPVVPPVVVLPVVPVVPPVVLPVVVVPPLVEVVQVVTEGVTSEAEGFSSSLSPQATASPHSIRRPHRFS